MEQNNQQYTPKQIIEITARLLGNIEVPVSLMESISENIKKAIINLRIALSIMDEQEREAQEPEQDDQEETEDGRDTDAE